MLPFRLLLCCAPSRLSDLVACIPLTLLVYWTLAAGSVLVTLLPVPVPPAFKDAVYLSACRGKLWQDKPAALGPMREWSVPQSWFLHFYLLGACCNGAVLLLYCCNLPAGITTYFRNVQPLLALLVFELHLVRRALETRLVMRYPRGAKMHGIAYLFGLSYYVAVPLSLLPSTWYDELSHQLPSWHKHQLSELLKVGVQQLSTTLGARSTWKIPQLQLGAAVFVAGNALQFSAHRALAALSARRNSIQKCGTTVYQIPTGGLFELVSCPHYLAEIIIYCGLALLAGKQLLPLLILVWVVLNLVLAATATHKWYKRKFENYPPQRRVLIPFIF